MSDLVERLYGIARFLPDGKATVEEAAAEIERLREENEAWQNQGLLEQCNRQADEIERLRQIIADAPHGPHCAGWHGHPEWGNMFVQDCDCWKSLAAKEG